MDVKLMMMMMMNVKRLESVKMELILRGHSSFFELASVRQLSVNPWKFEASSGGRMLFLTPTRYGLGKICWELDTYSVEVLHSD